MTSFTRGSTIHIAATFTDADGAAYTPTAPVVVLTYPDIGVARASTSINLALDTGEWVGDWDSSVAARAGTVYWTVYSDAPDPKIASDGEFLLLANASNLIAA